jgi:hypothetical protein
VCTSQNLLEQGLVSSVEESSLGGLLVLAGHYLGACKAHSTANHNTHLTFACCVGVVLLWLSCFFLCDGSSNPAAWEFHFRMDTMGSCTSTAHHHVPVPSLLTFACDVVFFVLFLCRMVPKPKTAWELRFRIENIGAWGASGFMGRWNLVVVVKPAIDMWHFRPTLNTGPFYAGNYSSDAQTFGFYVDVLKNICADQEVAGNYTWWCNMHQDWWVGSEFGVAVVGFGV